MSAPILGGIVLPRPNGAAESDERVDRVVTLAGGREVRYTRGRRRSYTLDWTSMTAGDLAAVRAATDVAGDVALVWVDGDVVTVYVDGPPKVTALPGTDPVRYAVSVALRSPQVRALTDGGAPDATGPGVIDGGSP